MRYAGVCVAQALCERAVPVTERAAVASHVGRSHLGLSPRSLRLLSCPFPGCEATGFGRHRPLLDKCSGHILDRRFSAARAYAAVIDAHSAGRRATCARQVNVSSVSAALEQSYPSSFSASWELVD